MRFQLRNVAVDLNLLLLVKREPAEGSSRTCTDYFLHAAERLRTATLHSANVLSSDLPFVFV